MISKENLRNLLTIVLLGIAITAIIYSVLVTNQYKETIDNYKAQLKESNETITTLRANLDDRNELIQTQLDYIEGLEETQEELSKQAKNLEKKNNSMTDELTVYREREELYNKYEYAIVDEDGNRTDLTYDQVKLGDDLMREKGFDPDLLFGTICVESGGDKNATNRYTAAAGYGQFIPESGKFVYENLMHAGTYNHSTTPYDGDTNIKMMAELYDYLYDKKGSTFQVVKCYCGGDDSFTLGYLSKVNRYTSKVGAYVTY